METVSTSLTSQSQMWSKFRTRGVSGERLCPQPCLSPSMHWVHTLDILPVYYRSNTYWQKNTFTLVFTASGNLEFPLHLRRIQVTGGNTQAKGKHVETKRGTQSPDSHPGPSCLEAEVSCTYKIKSLFNESFKKACPRSRSLDTFNNSLCSKVATLVSSETNACVLILYLLRKKTCIRRLYEKVSKIRATVSTLHRNTQVSCVTSS